jgi:toxin HigB-1
LFDECLFRGIIKEFWVKKLIVSFGDKRTEGIAKGIVGKGFPADIVKRAQLLLNFLETVERLDDLRSPPGNRLEKFVGNRTGQH